MCDWSFEQIISSFDHFFLLKMYVDVDFVVVWLSVFLCLLIDSYSWVRCSLCCEVKFITQVKLAFMHWNGTCILFLLDLTEESLGKFIPLSVANFCSQHPHVTLLEIFVFTCISKGKASQSLARAHTAEQWYLGSETRSC